MRASLGLLVLLGCGGVPLAAPTASPAEPAASEAASLATDESDASDESDESDETALTTRETAEPIETDEERAERERQAALRDARAEAVFVAADATAGHDALGCGAIGARVIPVGRVGSELNLCIAAMADEANRRRNAYGAVFDERSPAWTIAALVREAEAYESLDDAIDRATERIVEAALAPLGAAGRDDVRDGLLARVREDLEPDQHLIRCLSVARFVLAVRAARASETDSPFVHLAEAALAEHDDDTISECVTIMRTGDDAHGIAPDPSLAPWDRSERRIVQRGDRDEAPAPLLVGP